MNRLKKWYEEKDIFINDYQFAFRDKRSTVNFIFILHTILQNILSKNENLFCAFIGHVINHVLIRYLLITYVSSRYKVVYVAFFF